MPQVSEAVLPHRPRRPGSSRSAASRSTSAPTVTRRSAATTSSWGRHAGRRAARRRRDRPRRARRLPRLVPEAQGRSHLRLVSRLPRVLRPKTLPPRPRRRPARSRSTSSSGSTPTPAGRPASGARSSPSSGPSTGRRRMGLIEANPIRSVEKPKAGRRDHVITRRAVRRDPRPGPGRGIPRPADRLLGDRLPAAGGPLRRGPARRRGGRLLGIPRWTNPRARRAQRIVYLTDAALEITRRLAACRPCGPLFRNTDGSPWSSVRAELPFRAAAPGPRRGEDRSDGPGPTPDQEALRGAAGGSRRPRGAPARRRGASSPARLPGPAARHQMVPLQFPPQLRDPDARGRGRFPDSQCLARPRRRGDAGEGLQPPRQELDLSPRLPDHGPIETRSRADGRPLGPGRGAATLPDPMTPVSWSDVAERGSAGGGRVRAGPTTEPPVVVRLPSSKRTRAGHLDPGHDAQTGHRAIWCPTNPGESARKPPPGRHRDGGRASLPAHPCLDIRRPRTMDSEPEVLEPAPGGRSRRGRCGGRGAPLDLCEVVGELLLADPDDAPPKAVAAAPESTRLDQPVD